MVKNTPKLLSPAGNLDKLKTAIAFGADAVYCGIPDFSLRVRINDFDFKTLAEGIAYAHAHGKKIYLTLNIYPHERHLKRLPKYLEFIKKNRPDALIVSDPGIIAILRKKLPRIPLHLSTQANCVNSAAARFWQAQGIKRIILGRETTLEEIRAIHRGAPKMELEYFVHGAMCMSYSGRCILSKWLVNRSANLGDCVQPCRWEYEVSTQDERGQKFMIEEDRHGTYLLNSKDLCLIEYLDELKRAGISSFKIEGRAKSIYYVALTTKCYREAIDKKELPKKLKNELAKLVNRGFTTGFIFGEDKEIQNHQTSHNYSPYQFVGEVIKYDKQAGLATVRVHNSLFIGETVEFITPRGENLRAKIRKMIDPKNGKRLGEAHGGQGRTVLIKTLGEILPSTILVRKTANN